MLILDKRNYIYIGITLVPRSIRALRISAEPGTPVDGTVTVPATVEPGIPVDGTKTVPAKRILTPPSSRASPEFIIEVKKILG